MLGVALRHISSGAASRDYVVVPVIFGHSDRFSYLLAYLFTCSSRGL